MGFFLSPQVSTFGLIVFEGYLKGFDVKGMSEYVDYFNFMSYDIHGTWDGESEYTSPDINPHTNLTGMEQFPSL